MTDKPDPAPLPDWVETMMPRPDKMGETLESANADLDAARNEVSTAYVALQVAQGVYDAAVAKSREARKRFDALVVGAGEPQADGIEAPPATSATHPFLTPVKSSNIAGVGHDGQALWVKFLNGTLYRYPTAGADLHAGLVAAESAGSFFHKHVKSAHQGEKIS